MTYLKSPPLPLLYQSPFHTLPQMYNHLMCPMFVSCLFSPTRMLAPLGQGVLSVLVLHPNSHRLEPGNRLPSPKKDRCYLPFLPLPPQVPVTTMILQALLFP